MTEEHDAVILARQILAEAEAHVRWAERCLTLSRWYLAVAIAINLASIASWWFL